MTFLSSFDPQIFSAIQQERARQSQHIELIASENFTSPAVMEAQGSELTNKYAEGYPGKRYYGGCEFIDIAEQLAIDRAKELFGATYANVQPHSGASANLAVLMSLAQPGDTILGFDLSHGGHLTHGSPANFSGCWFNIVPYHRTTDLEHLDYTEIEELAQKHHPKIIIGGFSAFSNTVDWKRLRTIADSVGALLMADVAHVAGLIVAGEYPHPLPHAHVVTSTTHKTLRGPRGGIILSGSEDEEFLKKLNFSIFPFAQGGPLPHVMAAKAVAFKEALDPSFTEYQKQTLANSRALAKALWEKGIKTIGKEINNHIVLMDLSEGDISGKKAQRLLDEVKITTNRNTIPDDPRSPFITSGVRLGSPAVTTRGMKEAEMGIIAGLIVDRLNGEADHKIIERVLDLTSSFPIPGYQ